MYSVQPTYSEQRPPRVPCCVSRLTTAAVRIAPRLSLSLLRRAHGLGWRLGGGETSGRGDGVSCCCDSGHDSDRHHSDCMHASCFFFNQVCLIYFGSNQDFEAGEDYARHRVIYDKLMIKDKNASAGVY